MPSLPLLGTVLVGLLLAALPPALARANPSDETRLIGMTELAAHAERSAAPARLEAAGLAAHEAAVRKEMAGVAHDLEAAAREHVAALDELRGIGEALGHLEPLATLRPSAEGAEDEMAALHADLAHLLVGPEADPWARRWRVEAVELRLKRLKARAAETVAALKAWTGDQLAAIEGLLVEAGADTDRLLARVADDVGDGQGGPLEPVGELFGTDPATGPDGAVRRLAATKHLLTVLPLAVPLDEGRITSRFGVRRDPINRHRAMHAGMDFGAPPGSRIKATAPGTVVEAGYRGAYGIMVEIDHGYGIVTRYGHLKARFVKVGDAVPAGKPIGIIGSTGRSTGRHLHYEVMIDGRRLDPAGFLRASDGLTAVLAAES